MSTSKKDYEAIAREFKFAIESILETRTQAGNIEAERYHSGRLDGFEYAMRIMMLYFEQDNPLFDRTKFIKACGL